MRFYGENPGLDQKLRKNPKKQTKKRSRNNGKITGKKPTGKKSEVRIIIGIFVLSTTAGTRLIVAYPDNVLI